LRPTMSGNMGRRAKTNEAKTNEVGLRPTRSGNMGRRVKTNEAKTNEVGYDDHGDLAKGYCDTVVVDIRIATVLSGVGTVPVPSTHHRGPSGLHTGGGALQSVVASKRNVDNGKAPMVEEDPEGLGHEQQERAHEAENRAAQMRSSSGTYEEDELLYGQMSVREQARTEEIMGLRHERGEPSGREMTPQVTASQSNEDRMSVMIYIMVDMMSQLRDMLTRCIKFHKPPKHQIRCSITIKGGSHGSRPTHFWRHADRRIRSGQKLREDMLNPAPPTATIHGSVFTVEAMSSAYNNTFAPVRRTTPFSSLSTAIHGSRRTHPAVSPPESGTTTPVCSPRSDQQRDVMRLLQIIANRHGMTIVVVTVEQSSKIKRSKQKFWPW
ncbi:hypothetical protein ACLOJK_036593, partial [Asimina triloba]